MSRAGPALFLDGFFDGHSLFPDDAFTDIGTWSSCCLREWQNTPKWSVLRCLNNSDLCDLLIVKDCRHWHHHYCCLCLISLSFPFTVSNRCLSDVSHPSHAYAPQACSSASIFWSTASMFCALMRARLLWKITNNAVICYI